jgi:hypothetical protein
MVVNANVYDSLFAVAATDFLQTDVVEQVGGTVPAPTTTGVPDVNTERWADTLVTLSGALPDVNVEAMDVNSIATGVMATDSIGVLAMATGSISAGTIASGELTNIENEIWDALKSAHVVANSFGDFLDIEVSGRLASADINLTAGAIDNVTLVATATNLTNAATSGDLTAAMKTSVNVEVLDVLTVDTFAEPAQGAPLATTTILDKLGHLYKSLRNRKTATATQISIFNDDTTTIDHKRTISDNGTTYDEEEIVSGP